MGMSILLYCASAQVTLTGSGIVPLPTTMSIWNPGLTLSSNFLIWHTRISDIGHLLAFSWYARGSAWRLRDWHGLKLKPLMIASNWGYVQAVSLLLQQKGYWHRPHEWWGRDTDFFGYQKRVRRRAEAATRCRRSYKQKHCILPNILAEMKGRTMFSQ